MLPCGQQRWRQGEEGAAVSTREPLLRAASAASPDVIQNDTGGMNTKRPLVTNNDSARAQSLKKSSSLGPAPAANPVVIQDCPCAINGQAIKNNAMVSRAAWSLGPEILSFPQACL